ncbi:DUF445 family protein [Marinobacteraceae bacterium S3BR75-40.1]
MVAVESVFKLIVLLPLGAAFVGWGTNWLAVRMSFYPVNFIGLAPYLGWQGVIPRKSEKMAHICVDRTLSQFGSLQDVYERLDPALITGQILSQIAPRIDEYIDEIMYELQPVLWDNVPRSVRNRIYRWARAQLPERVEALVEDFGDELGDLVDLKALLSAELKRNPDLMNRIFQEAGGQQFRFLVRAGGPIGGLLGALALPAVLNGWVAHPLWFPVLGFFIGFLTNWIALSLLFRPVNEYRIGPWRFQGLFLKRQPEISKVWSRVVAEDLLTVERVAHAMLHGDKSSRTRAIIQKHLRPMLDQSATMKLMTQVAVGMTGYTELKKAMNEKAIRASDEAFHNPSFNRDRAPIVAAAIEERISALPPRQFQDILRPAFQEEEWLLMLVGGILGAVAGLTQWFFMSGA